VPELEHTGVHEVEVAPPFLQFNRHILLEQEEELSRICRTEGGLASADNKKALIPLRLMLAADGVPQLTRVRGTFQVAIVRH
jgi:hypothetical protein